MDTAHYLPTHHAHPYTSLPGSPRPEPDHSPSGIYRRPIKIIFALLVSFILLVLLVVVNPQIKQVLRKVATSTIRNSNVGDYLSSSRQSTAEPSFPWTNDEMLAWQRPSYHFQPEKNFMSDPNGPLFYKGYYHIFYQYNPDSAIWGNITWGHAVSTDLINWLLLPCALEPDQWYDTNGVWSGSSTVLPDGKIILLYTGGKGLLQVQNLAYPANLSDPLLIEWVKYPGNPVLYPPPGIGDRDFRDPTTAWLGPEGKWRIAIGSKRNYTGVSLVYQTTDFINYELLDGSLHAVPDTGMWECVDFYPVSVSGSNGLDTSFNGTGVKHVLKYSSDDFKHDYYALGSFDPFKDKWTPDHPELDVGLGLRLDYGKYYASKSFYDPEKKRRLVWGWIGETDGRATDLLKGWASVQSIRTVVFDNKTGTHLLLWPVKEVESLRSRSYEIDDVELKPGSVVPLKISPAAQLDIVVTFEVDKEAVEGASETDASFSCNVSRGAAGRNILGPFGILVLADDSLSELTPVFFYIAKSVDGSSKTFFCTDQSRSSTSSYVDPELGTTVYGSDVPVLHGEKLSMRLLVDHSVVESFAQGGRTVVSSRVYPTRAIYSSARVFLFNNATGLSVTASVKAWQMGSATLKPFPFDQL